MNDRTRDTLRVAAEAERALIGCVLRRPGEMAAAAHVRPEDFRDAAHQILWRSLLALHAEGVAASPVDLLDRVLRDNPPGSFPAPGGSPAALIAELYEGCGAPSAAARHAAMVLDHALLRGLGDYAREVQALADAPPGSAREVLSAAEKGLHAIADRGQAGGPVPLSVAVEEALEGLARAIDRPDEAALSSGLVGLDQITGCWRPGELVVVAARPSVGKTAIALAMARDAAAMGRAVLFSSIEMRRRELAQRLLLGESPRVTGRHARHPQTIGPVAFAELVDCGRRLGDLPLWVDDHGEQSVLRVASAARRMARHGLGLVVVDYLQLLEPEDARATRQEQVACFARRLKQLARELDVPVVALAQLNRESESRADRRPRLGDLRESGAVEQDADVVVLLHRPDEQRDRLDLIVAKNRNGDTGEVSVRFDRARMRFLEDTGGADF